MKKKQCKANIFYFYIFQEKNRDQLVLNYLLYQTIIIIFHYTLEIV